MYGIDLGDIAIWVGNDLDLYVWVVVVIGVGG